MIGAHDWIHLSLREIYDQKQPLPRMSPPDKIFWVFMSKSWSRWKEILVVVEPNTVGRWHQIKHGRRKILHFNVTANPTANWVIQQLQEAFPYETSVK